MSEKYSKNLENADVIIETSDIVKSILSLVAMACEAEHTDFDAEALSYTSLALLRFVDVIRERATEIT